MRNKSARALCLRAALTLGVGLAATLAAGCGFSLESLNELGQPLFGNFGRLDDGSGGPVTPSPDPGDDNDGFFNGGNRAEVDPCQEELERKFITLSLRNQSPDFVHYFMALIALVDTPERPGAVCPDDLGLYTDFGYQFIAAGQELEFGVYCIEGPALFYFHEFGNFRAGGGVGASSLAAGIAPAQGVSPTFDNLFGSAGARVPVPDTILFHNPGTGQGASLIVDPLPSNPCQIDLGVEVNVCALDAFYYVDDTDVPAGSLALGAGSARRTPAAIQGTGCEIGIPSAGHNLAPSGETASSALDDEFLRGGRIEYVFIRDDRSPPVPQLLWRVRDANGSLAHDFAVEPD